MLSADYIVNSCGIVILAAGASTRLGKPKQLLQYHGKTLLDHSVNEAINAKADAVVVILGKNADLLQNKIDNQKVNVVINKDWEEGMAASVRLGLATLLKIKPYIDAVIFMVCDQPHISSLVLNELITTQQKTTKQIVTCNYGGSIGPPALFHKKYFRELAKVKGDIGARNIIQQNMNDVATILFPEGKIDIDTQEDYDALESST
ncbi:MAG TPA: nucleotidyltransferase family protein [Chitinophagaceae bacterium]|nr:nucleotidyltransferase family protein [Chitinophagaceae bacterium]